MKRSASTIAKHVTELTAVIAVAAAIVLIVMPAHEQDPAPASTVSVISNASR